MKNKLKKSLLACSLLSMPFSSSMAYDLPGFNVGATSFYDGAPAPQGPGYYFIEYLQYSSADKLANNSGDKLGLPKEETDIFVPLSQLLYVSPTRWGNVTPGVTALLPWMAKATVNDGANNTILKSQKGVGDLTLGAFLQFDPIMGKEGPIFSQRIEMDVAIPTGKYDEKNAINPGSNFYSIAPYYAATYWINPKWTVSSRFIYLYNAKNNKSNIQGATTSQVGQAININFASAYALTNNLSLGINGYWLNQFTDTKLDDKATEGRREKAWAIGPGMVYKLGKDDSIFANFYSQHGTRNRAEGNHFVLRFNHHF